MTTLEQRNREAVGAHGVTAERSCRVTGNRRLGAHRWERRNQAYTRRGVVLASGFCIAMRSMYPVMQLHASQTARKRQKRDLQGRGRSRGGGEGTERTVGRRWRMWPDIAS